MNVRAPRGAILDREGRLLVNSRPTYNVVLSRSEMRGRDFDALVAPLSRALGLDPDYLRERFEEARHAPAFESVTVKESATTADVAWLDAHALEFPALRVEPQPQRLYPAGGVLAHVVGYVGEISSRQLESRRVQRRGLQARRHHRQGRA